MGRTDRKPSTPAFPPTTWIGRPRTGESPRLFAPGLPVALLLATLAAPPPTAAQTVSPEAWVGCWYLEHLEDWAPAIPEAGFPSGTQAPAPRTLLLDRLRGSRLELSAAPGARTWRAEWLDPAIRSTEVWALRQDDQVLVEGSPGVRALSVLMEGPPVVDGVPARWFFRRTDSRFPETRALVAGQPMACPEGQGPHSEVHRPELAERMAELGMEGSFVLYDAEARRFVRSDPARASDRVRPGGALKIPTILLAAHLGSIEAAETFAWDGSPQPHEAWESDLDLGSAASASAEWVFRDVASRVPAAAWARNVGWYGNRTFGSGDQGPWATAGLQISSDEKVAWMVDLLRDGSVPTSRPTGSGPDPISLLEEILHLETRDGVRIFGTRGPTAASPEAPSWAVGWVRDGSALRVFAMHVAPMAGAPPATGSGYELALEFLEALGAVPDP